MTRRKLPIGIQVFPEIREAVHCALPGVVRGAARHREIEALVTMDGLDLADRKIMKNAWRS